MTKHHFEGVPHAPQHSEPEHVLGAPPPLDVGPAPTTDRRTGRWIRKPARSGRASDEPLSWQREVSLWERIGAQVSVPKAAAIIVFTAALVVTAVVMLRALAGPGSLEEPHGSLSQGAPTGEASSGEALKGRDTAASTSQNASGEATESKIFVHVVGEVERPGVVELSAGARVLEAIDAAGGATPLAELSAVNLARAVTDGEQIVVLDAASAAQLQVGSAPGNTPSGLAGGQGEAAGNGINVNSASADELTGLPGIGPALAKRIVDWREANGPFASVEQLTEVSGIGPKTLGKFRDRVIL